MSAITPRRALPGISGLAAPLAGIAVVAALYFGRDVLVPLALAILLSFVLAPLVRLLQNWRVPRGVAVVFVAVLAFAAILATGAVVISQVNQLAADLPRYQSTLREKIQAVRGATASSGTLEKAADVLSELGAELKGPAGAGPETRQPSSREAGPRPIPVEIREPDAGALRTIVAIITPLIHPLATSGIVFIFVIFILLHRGDLRNRIVRLGGVQDIQRTTAALGDAGKRLSQLFLTQLVLNAAFGLVIGVGLLLIGVPSAPLWGILAMILRFVPYVGAVIAAIFPLILAAAVGPDWTMLVWTLILFAVVEPLTGHVIEPMAAGHSTGLSPVAVIVSATFWTWLWGPVGLVLATPLTVCLVVLGKHVEQLKFLDVMFGDEPVLSPAELIYQRMLAGDAVEAAEQAEEYLEEHPLERFYDEVMVDSLRLAQTDAERGDLEQERLARVQAATRVILEDLETHVDVEPSKDEGKPPTGPVPGPDIETTSGLPERWRTEGAVLCVPGHGELDDMLALIVAQLLKRRGVGARAESANAISMGRLLSLEPGGLALVCVCFLTGKPAQVRYALRRLRRQLPNTAILVCHIGSVPPSTDGEQQGVPENVIIRTSVEATIAEIFEQSRRSIDQGPS